MNARQRHTKRFHDAVIDATITACRERIATLRASIDAAGAAGVTLDGLDVRTAQQELARVEAMLAQLTGGGQ